MLKYEDEGSLHSFTRSSPPPSRSYCVYPSIGCVSTSHEGEKSSPHRKRKYSDVSANFPERYPVNITIKRNAYITPPVQREIPEPDRPVKIRRKFPPFCPSPTPLVRNAPRRSRKQPTNGIIRDPNDKQSRKRKSDTGEIYDDSYSLRKKIKDNRERSEEQQLYENKPEKSICPRPEEKTLNLAILEMNKTLLVLLSTLIKENLQQKSHTNVGCCCAKQQNCFPENYHSEPDLPNTSDNKIAQPPTYSDSIFVPTSDCNQYSDMGVNSVMKSAPRKQKYTPSERSGTPDSAQISNPPYFRFSSL